ncbi:Schwann cell myelin protein-like, partial [Arapaima gigas]
IYQPAEIKAEIGHPVTLSCTFNQSDDNTERIFAVFTTKQGDKNDIDGNLSKKCRQLASEQQLFLCECSLSVRAVRLEDEGVYYCKVIILAPNTGGIFRSTSGGTKLSLYVTIEQPRPLVSGHEATLTCTASGFYPQNASVLWSHRGDQVPPSSVTTETKKSNDGTFQLHSEYRFSPTATDHGTESSCTVSHPDWSDGRTDSISLSVSCE